MLAKELRIGNWIEKDGKKYQATAMTIFCIGDKHNPIQLTEEWLIKFGFKYDANEGYKYIDEDSGEEREIESRPYWYIHYDDNMRFIFYFDDMKANGCKSEYVHQLQNAFFIKTGNDLIIHKK